MEGGERGVGVGEKGAGGGGREGLENKVRRGWERGKGGRMGGRGKGPFSYDELGIFFSFWGFWFWCEGGGNQGKVFLPHGRNERREKKGKKGGRSREKREGKGWVERRK